MGLMQIGKKVRERRAELGIAQKQLSELSGVSRVTINQLENGALEDLGYARLNSILNVLGITLEAKDKAAHKHALKLAAQTASTSYKAVLTPSNLKKILRTGQAPKEFEAHIMTLLEAPESIILGAVKQAAAADVPPQKIMKHISKWAREWQTNRRVWV